MTRCNFPPHWAVCAVVADEGGRRWRGRVEDVGLGGGYGGGGGCRGATDSRVYGWGGGGILGCVSTGKTDRSNRLQFFCTVYGRSRVTRPVNNMQNHTHTSTSHPIKPVLVP